MPDFVILARGGSVGVPGKNKMLFDGKPLVAIAIDKCLQAYRYSRVIVSTDDADIASIAEEYGAEQVMRPADLATSDSLSVDGLRHAAEAAGLTDTIGLVQCTNPFVSVNDIVGTIRVSRDHDMAVCVEESHDLLIGTGGNAINWDTGQTIRQHREKQYRIVGSVWAFSPGYIDQPQYSGDVGIHIAESAVQIDIDTPTDASVAQALYEKAKIWPAL